MGIFLGGVKCRLVEPVAPKEVLNGGEWRAGDREPGNGWAGPREKKERAEKKERVQHESVTRNTRVLEKFE